MEYYVYAHLNPKTLNPFYIGKGKGNRFRVSSDRSIVWNNHANKYGFIPVKLVDGLSNESACEIEKQYISRYGFKKSGGLLVNLTSGGSGGNTFDPINNTGWRKGIPLSNERKERLRQVRLGTKLSPDVKVKVLAGLKKALEASAISRTHKVRCLSTMKEWDNRHRCCEELDISISTFKNRVAAKKNIKGHYLQLFK